MNVTVTDAMLDAGYEAVKGMASDEGESWAFGMAPENLVRDALLQVYQTMRKLEPEPDGDAPPLKPAA